MKKVKIKLGTIDLVKRFVKVITEYEGDFELTCDHYSVDARSIMGIFTLNLTKELELSISNLNGDYEELERDLAPFKAKAVVA